MLYPATPAAAAVLCAPLPGLLNLKLLISGVRAFCLGAVLGHAVHALHPYPHDSVSRTVPDMASYHCGGGVGASSTPS